MDASPHLMAPTQEEEFKGDKRLASPQTRNSGSTGSWPDAGTPPPEAALAASTPSPLRITVPAFCYAVTQQEASYAGDLSSAPVEKLLTSSPPSVIVTCNRRLQSLPLSFGSKTVAFAP